MPLASSNHGMKASDVVFFNYGLTSSSLPSHGLNHITLKDSLILMVTLALEKKWLKKEVVVYEFILNII